jgi:hypothetical protein
LAPAAAEVDVHAGVLAGAFEASTVPSPGVLHHLAQAERPAAVAHRRSVATLAALW